MSYGLSAVGSRKFIENIAEVALDGSNAHLQTIGNLGVPQTIGYKPKNIELTRCKSSVD